MLIEIITFEIRNFKNGTFADYVVENTPVNFELISAHKYTREISFGKMFDFEFVNNCKYPQFIELAEATAIAYFENKDIVEIDDVDEMVGIY